jgi:SAM-dependent methyltransferase
MLTQSNAPSDDFDEFARDYGEVLDQSLGRAGADGTFFAKNRVQWVKDLEARAGRSPARILDLGCGDGSTDVYLCEAFPHAALDGADVSTESIQVAAERGLSRVEFRPYDGHVLPYGDDRFDLVFVAGVLHHVPQDDDRIELVREISRVLKPGGGVYIFEQNPANPATRRIVDRCPFDRHARLLKAKELKELLALSPFADVEIRFILFAPRHKVFAPIHAVEHRLTRVPVGAQYFVSATKP